MKKSISPTRSKHTIFKQLCEHIPAYLVERLARKHKIKTRGFTEWSHVVALLYAQFTHALGLNDVCDALRNHCGALVTLRGARAPSRNGLSHANRNRPAAMAEELFWTVLKQLQTQSPGFGGWKYPGFPRRFKRAIRIVDSTTMTLVANCIDWARHSRRKAAAKMHLRLDLQSFLPNFAIVDTARHNDALRARELCAGLQNGEIVVFDKAYVDYEHLNDMNERGVIWVSRAKDNMDARCVKRRLKKQHGDIVRDDEIELRGCATRNKYHGRLRLITAWVVVDEKRQLMRFMTNQMDWAASSICDLYECRWSIEAFFKQIKQTLQLSDFLGHSKNAIQWQVWTALLTYLLLRFMVFTSHWKESFIRMFTVVRGVLWSFFDLLALLRSYGTADDPLRMRATPEQAFLPGFGTLCGTAQSR